MKMKKIIKYIVSALVVIIILFLLQCLLRPKYVSDVTEGRLIAEYYQEEKNHDVVFIGDCEVYENISPVVLWQDFGINSYIRGSAQQLIWQSYYLLEDTLRYEKPDVIVFNVLSLKYNEPQKEAYNRMTLDGMRWSMSKVKSIFASMTSRENFLDYVFPILRYHSRWSELEADDVTHMFEHDTMFHNGYYMRVDTKPAKDVPEGKILGDYNFGENAYSYLDKMTELCKKEGIELVLIKAPSLYPYWYDEWEQQIEDYAEKNNLLYVNLLEDSDKIGLDFSKDTYDGGLHLNLYGAEKATRYLGEILQTQLSLINHHGDEHLEEIWDEKIKAYEADRLQKMADMLKSSR